MIVQTFFWGAPYKNIPGMGIFSGAIRALREIWKEIIYTITIWDEGSGKIRTVMFVRMAVTFVLLLGIIAIVLATYDSVSSFWVYFMLYLGIALLLVPVIGQIINYIFSGRNKADTSDSD